MAKNIDDQYLDLVAKILSEGELKENRTGIDTLAIAGATIEHDMSEGFPLLTTKKMYFKGVKVELEGFIKGIRSKQWYKDRGCNIWNEWCNPRKVAYGNDAESKAKMEAEDDLGIIYGVQWRDFKAPSTFVEVENDDMSLNSMRQHYGPALGVDQLAKIVSTLKTNPNDRRMICSAWNPLALDQMALPPCHLLWQVTVINGKLNLAWYQRSVDVPLGLPFNIASYGLLLHLLAKQAGLKEGRLIGFLMDTHIYVNQVDALKEQLGRARMKLPTVATNHAMGSDGKVYDGNGFDIFNWSYGNTALLDYVSHPPVKFDIAV
jgi:thymidylate synthase